MKRVRVQGLNINRLLNEMQNQKILPQNIKRVEYDEIIFEISNIEYKKLVANRLSSCYNISVIMERAEFPLAILLLKRVGLLIGLVVAIVLLASTISKVWNINISVSGEADRDINLAVQEALNSTGVMIGQPLNISTRDLERKLTSMIDESASVVVAKNGVNLDVFVKLRVYKPEQSNTDIVSAYDGKIIDIKLTSGILCVNIGEGVSKGQVLIASGTVGDYFAEAKGEIFAKVLISGSAVGSAETEIMERTGTYVDVKAYEIFGKTFFFEESLEDATSAFEGAEVERSEVVISPLKKVTYRVYELKTKKVLRTHEEVVNSLKNQAYITAKNNLPDGAEEGAVSYDVFNENGLIKVVCNIETEISIGIRSTK